MAAFTEPYGPFRPWTGTQRIGTILLEPGDVRSRHYVAVIGVQPDQRVRCRTFPLISRHDPRGIIPRGEDPEFGSLPERESLPEGPRFTGRPATLIDPEQMLITVFAIDEHGDVHASTQARETDDGDRSNWSTWGLLPRTGRLTSGLATANSPDGGLASVFALGDDGRVHQIVYSRAAGGGWGVWSALPGGGAFVGGPAVLNSPDGVLVSVFALGDDGRVHQIVYSRAAGGGWGSWSALPGGGAFVGGPAVLNSPDGVLVSVFALGDDGRVHQIVYSRAAGGGWGSWSALPGGGALVGGPVALNSPGSARTTVFAHGPDKKVHRTSWTEDGGWDTWRSIPGSDMFEASPAVTPCLHHRLSRDAIRAKLFTDDDSVQAHFEETSYGRFGIAEAFTTPWIRAEDDPTTGDVDESTYEYLHTGGLQLETEKSRYVVAHAEKTYPGLYASVDWPTPDGHVTADELSLLWLYSGGGFAGARQRPVPAVEVPSLTTGVEVGNLPRCEHHCPTEAVAHELAHTVLGLSDLYTGAELKRLAIGAVDDRVHAWYTEARLGTDIDAVPTVSSGNSRDLATHRPRSECSYAPGKATKDLVGVAIKASYERPGVPYDHVYAWYADRTFSSGTVTTLDRWGTRSTYSLPPGRRTDEVVDMAMTRDGHVFTWYSNETYTEGTAHRLDAHAGPNPYLLPPGLAPADVYGFGIAGSDGHVYAWYRDGTVSSGTAADLDCYRSRQTFEPPPEAYPGPGALSLMGYQGPGSHLDPWHKVKLGWVNPRVVKASATYPLQASERYPDVCILHDPAHGEHEYFMVENRYPPGSLEKAFPGKGLAIWHIHERPTSDLSDYARKTVHLVKPGGPGAPDAEALWDASGAGGPCYDLTDDSLPANTRWDDGSRSGIAIRTIPIPGPAVRVYFEVP